VACPLEERSAHPRPILHLTFWMKCRGALGNAAAFKRLFRVSANFVRFWTKCARAWARSATSHGALGVGAVRSVGSPRRHKRWERLSIPAWPLLIRGWTMNRRQPLRSAIPFLRAGRS
jgi:hypothetical protein